MARKRWAGLTAAILTALTAIDAHAAAAAPRITPEGLVLVVNKQQPSGRELAERYAKLRNVPDGRIVEIDVPDSVEIDSQIYDRAIADVVRQQIDAKHLRESVQCIVTFYGVPLRIRERAHTPAERTEVEQILDPMINALRQQLRASVQDAEAVAIQLDPAFKVDPKADSTDQIRLRGVAAEKSIQESLKTRGEPARSEVLTKLQAARAKLTKMPDMPSAPATKPTTAPTQLQVNGWLQSPDDAEARRELRDAIYFNGNVFQLLMLAETQKRTLTASESESSVDSELSCLWLQQYPRAKWLPNPFHYASQAAASRTQFVRVARIDGPTPEVAKRTFEESIATEQHGLSGDVVLDARGMTGTGGPGTYDNADQAIRNVAKYLTGIDTLKPVFDNNPNLLPDNSSDHAAIYCGWYSVRKYKPTVKLVPGSIAWHVASYEMVDLRSAAEQGWCRNLLLNGADVTVGPVGEPYLVAFPPADEFFALLLTGKASVAEAYWATVPITSWKMVLIGDPLYRPFVKSMPLGVDRLPAGLANGLSE